MNSMGLRKNVLGGARIPQELYLDMPAVDFFNRIRYGAAAMRPLATNLLQQLVITATFRLVVQEILRRAGATRDNDGGYVDVRGLLLGERIC